MTIVGSIEVEKSKKTTNSLKTGGFSQEFSGKLLNVDYEELENEGLKREFDPN